MPGPFDVSSVVHEHPRQDKDRIASKAKIITHLSIGTIPSFLFLIFFLIMLKIYGLINRSERLCGASSSHIIEVLASCLSSRPASGGVTVHERVNFGPACPEFRRGCRPAQALAKCRGLCPRGSTNFVESKISD
jgi:hypothetical protein